MDRVLVTELVAHDGEVEDSFGYSVAVSEDVIAVGAPEDSDVTGAVHLFTTDREKLIAPDGQAEDFFGFDVSIFENILVVGAPAFKSTSTMGSVYLYLI